MSLVLNNIMLSLSADENWHCEDSGEVIFKVANVIPIETQESCGCQNQNFSMRLKDSS